MAFRDSVILLSAFRRSRMTATSARAPVSIFGNVYGKCAACQPRSIPSLFLYFFAFDFTSIVTLKLFLEKQKKVLTNEERRGIIIKCNEISGCGAVGSALPWGGRGRKFKSCHSDQKTEIVRSPFFFVFRRFSLVFSHF